MVKIGYNLVYNGLKFIGYSRIDPIDRDGYIEFLFLKDPLYQRTRAERWNFKEIHHYTNPKYQSIGGRGILKNEDLTSDDNMLQRARTEDHNSKVYNKRAEYFKKERSRDD